MAVSRRVVRGGGRLVGACACGRCSRARASAGGECRASWCLRVFVLDRSLRAVPVLVPGQGHGSTGQVSGCVDCGILHKDTKARSMAAGAAGFGGGLRNDACVSLCWIGHCGPSRCWFLGRVTVRPVRSVGLLTVEFCTKTRMHEVCGRGRPDLAGGCEMTAPAVRLPGLLPRAAGWCRCLGRRRWTGRRGRRSPWLRGC